MYKLKRAYESPLKSDGERILVERLWPRGLTKTKAKIDLWLKDIAPSTDLRQWYAHDPAKWPDFQRRYRLELKDQGSNLRLLKQKGKKGVVTFVFAAKDEKRNSAVVLKKLLDHGTTTSR